MKKKLFWWLFLFVFLTTFYFDLSKTNLLDFFIIKNFEIKNTENTDIGLVNSKLEKFKNNNIFLINNDEIASSITDLDFVKNIGIKTIISNGTIKIFGNPNITLNKKIIIKNYLKDHRVFMTSVIAALTFGGEWHIHDKDAIKTSFPSFLKIINTFKK